MKRIVTRPPACCLPLIGLLTGILIAPSIDAQTASNQSKDHPSSASVVSYATGRSAPVFIENRGQFDSRVRFQVTAREIRGSSGPCTMLSSANLASWVWPI